MPLMARSFSTPGKARQLAWKTTMLARSGTVRMPTIYGVMTHEEHPAPMSCYWSGCVVFRWKHQPEHQNAGNDSKTKSLKPYWPGTVRTVASQSARSTILAENFWPSWYRQHVEVLWTTLNQFNNTGLTMQDKRILFRTRECLPALFEGFNDNCVLIHGNFCLRSMLKDSRSDQLLAIVAGTNALGTARIRTVPTNG